MTARTKVTLVEASGIKTELIDIIKGRIGNEVMCITVVDALFAAGVIDPDAVIRRISNHYDV